MKLIVIDMQKALMDDALYDRDGLLKNVSALIGAARENGVEVIYIKHDAGEGSGFSVGDEGFEIAGEVAPQEGEKVFVKTASSSFLTKEFAEYLEKAGDNDLMIVGLQTNFCIDATVKSAFERGYYVMLPEGTNSTFDNPYMSGKTTYEYYMNEVWPGLFADCISMEDALGYIKNGVPQD